MTIVTLTETPQGAALSSFNQGGEMLATNFMVDYGKVSFATLVETIGMYLRQYARQDGPRIIVAIHEQQQQSSLMYFLTQELEAMGAAVVVAGGEGHQDMANAVSKAIEEQIAKEAEAQKKAAEAQAQAGEAANEPESGKEGTPAPEVEAEAEKVETAENPGDKAKRQRGRSRNRKAARNN